MMQESATFSVFGLTGYAYGAFIAAGIVLALRLFAAVAREKQMPAGITPLFAVLSILLGVFISRLLFCLLDFRFHGVFSLKAALMFWGGGFSMTGALLGAAVAALITARAFRIYPLSLLDMITPVLLLFIAAARMGEGFTELLGRSRPLTTSWLASSFLAQSDGYDAYLRTYLLEGLTAAVLCVFMTVRVRNARIGNTFLSGMLLLGCTQTFWESLRFDSHMRYSFISMQQILFACMFACPLIYYAGKCGKKALITAICVCVLLVGCIVGLEFMIDRSSISNIILYIPYALLLAVPAVLGFYYQRRSEKA